MPFGATELGRAYIVVTADPKRLYASLEGIKGRTAALAASIERSFGGLRRSFRHIGAGLAEIEAGFSRLARAVAPFAIAVGGLSGLGIKLAADFERAMADVAAVLGKPIDAIQDLTEYAKRMGIETVFSAREAAEAMYYLASAGYDAKEIMAALRPALDLAAATQADLAFATETVVTALAGFRYESDEAARVANTFAAAISGSQATIEKLGHSMRYVGPIAASLGWQIEDVVAVLGKLYDAGLRGEQAGTALRGMLAALMHPVGQTEKALEELGISSAALAEALKNPITLLALLQKHLVDTETGAIDVRNAVRLVGREAGPALAALLSLGVEGLAEFRKQITGTEKASQMAAIQLTAFSAQVKMLMASLEAVALEAFGPLLPIMRTFIEERLVPATNEIARLIREAGGLPGIFARIRESIRAAGFEGLIITLGKLTGALLAFAAASRILRPILGAFLAMGRGVRSLAIGLLALPAPLKLLIGLAAAFAYAWQRNVGQVRKVIKELWAAVAPAVRELGRAFAEMVGIIGPAMRKLLHASALLAVQFLHLLVPALEALSPLIIIAAKAISQFAEQMKKAVAEGRVWPIALAASVFGLIAFQSALLLALRPLRLLLRFLLLLFAPFIGLTRICFGAAKAILLVVRALALLFIPAALKGLLVLLSPLRLLLLGVGRAVLLFVRAFAAIRTLQGVLIILGTIAGLLSWKLLLFGLVATAAIAAAAAIVRHWGAIKEKIKAVKDAVSNFFSSIGEGFQRYGQLVWNWIVRVSQRIARGFIWFGHAAWDWIVDVSQGIAEGFIWFGHATWNWIITVAQKIAAGFIWFGHATWSWIVNVSQKIAAGFREFGHAIWNWVVNVGQIIVPGFIWFSHATWNWIVKVSQKIAVNFREFSHATWDWVVSVTQNIVAGFREFGHAMWNWVVNVSQNIAEGFREFTHATWNWIINVSQRIPADFKRFTHAAWDWIINVSQSIAADFKEFTRATWDWTINVTQNIATGFREFSDAIWNWLIRVSQEVAANVVHFRDRLIKWTIRVVQEFWGAFRELPERVIDWTVRVSQKFIGDFAEFKERVITWTVNLTRGSVEAVADWVERSVNWVVNLARGSAEAVQGWLDRVITWVVNLVRGTWAEIPELADRVFTWTIDIVVRGWERAKEIFEAIKNFFLDLGERIKAFFTRTIPGFFERLIFGVEAQAAEAEGVEVAPTVITPEAARERFQELLTFLETEFLARWTDAFGGVRESFRIFLDEFAAEGERFPGIVGDLLDKVKASFADFSDYLKQDFLTIWDWTWSMAEEAVKSFASNLAAAFQQAKVELISLTGALSREEAIWAGIWVRAAQKIEGFVGAVKEKLTELISAVSFLIERVSSIMTENWPPIWEGAKAAVADFASFVQAEMGAVRGAVASFASEAASALAALGDELAELQGAFSKTVEALKAEPLGKLILEGLQPYIAEIGSTFAILGERISSALAVITGAVESLLEKVQQAVAAIKELQAAEIPEAPPKEEEKEPAEEETAGEKFTEFQEGGLVPGVGRGDRLLALLEPGELIFSREMVHEHPWLIELYAGLRRGPELLLPTPLISELLEVLPPRETPEEFQVLGEVLEAPEAARITPIAAEKLEALRTQVLAWEPDPEQLEKIGWGPEHLESLKENILAFAERLAEQGVPGEEALGILAAIFAGERLPVEIPRGLEPPPIGIQLATQLRDLWDRIRWYPAFLVGPLRAQVELSLSFLREMGYQRGGLADLGRYWGNLLARALVEWWSAFKVLPQLQLGGRVPGAGVGDRIPALLEPGELVFPADIVRRSPWLLALYERLRRPLGFQEGGLVPGVPVERRLEFGVPAVEVEPGFFGRIAEFFTNLFRSIFEMLRDFFTGLFNEIASFFKDIFEEFEVPSEQMGELDEQLAELETAIGKETEAAEARAKASEAETEASEETKESSFDLAAVLAEIEKIERELGETTEGTETKTEASAEALEELENQLEELREIEDPAERARNLTALISQYKDNTAALARIAKEVTRFENELSDTKELLASAGEETAKIDRALEILAGSAEELKSEELATTDQLTDLRERLAEITEIEDPVERAQQLRTLVGEYQDNIEALSLIGREMRSLRRDLRASGEALAAAGLSAEQVKEALSILEDVSTETVDPLAELGRKLEEIRRIEDPLAQVEKLRELIPLYAGNAEALQVLRREVDSMRGVFQDSRQMLQRAGRSTEQLDAALESLTAASEEIEAALEEGSTALDELAERLERIARIEDPVRRARAYMALMAEYDGQAEALQAIRQEADRFRQGLEELGPALDPERVQEALGVLESASEESSLSILAAAKEQQGALAAAAKETEDALAAFREQLEARLDVRAPLRSIEILRQAIEENAEDVRRLQIVFAVLSEFKGQLETLMRAYALTGRSTGKLSEAIMEAEQLLAARMPAITTELIASAEAGIVALRRLRELAQKHRDEADVLARIVSQHKALEDHLSSLRSELERQRESYAALGLSTAALDAAITALRIELEAASPAVAELQRILAGLDALPLAEAGAAIHDLARAFRDQPEILELIAEKARSLASTLEQEISTREALGLSTQALRKQLEAFWSAVKGTRVEFGYLRDISRRLTETFESAIGRVGDFIRQRIMEKFSSWIKKIIYRLFGLKDSTEELHSAMVNVPQGFKATLQRLRYAVAIPDQPPIEDREENFLDWLKRLIADALILFIEEILGAGFDWLFDFVAAGFSWVFKHALDLLAAAFDFLVELAGGSFGILKEIGGAVLAGVPPMIRQILGALLGALVGWWVKDLAEALGIFEGFAAILGGALVTLIGGVIAGPMGAFAAALVYIAGLLVEAAGGIDALLKAIADAITHVGKLFVDAAIGFVRTLAFIPWLLIKPFEVIFGILKEIPLLGFLFKGIWRTLKDMAAALEGVMPYQEGGLVKRTGLALVHQGEYVLPAGAGLPLETAIDINLEVSSPQPSGVWLRVEDPDVVRKIQDYVRRKNLAWDGSYAGRALVDGAA